MTPRERFGERIGGFPPGVSRYRLVSAASLPLRLGGEYSYQTAYRLASEWNQRHNADEMARIEPVEKRDG